MGHMLDDDPYMVVSFYHETIYHSSTIQSVKLFQYLYASHTLCCVNIVPLISNFILVLLWNITNISISCHRCNYVRVHNRYQMALDKTGRSLAGYTEDGHKVIEHMRRL